MLFLCAVQQLVHGVAAYRNGAGTQRLVGKRGRHLRPRYAIDIFLKLHFQDFFPMPHRYCFKRCRGRCSIRRLRGYLFRCCGSIGSIPNIVRLGNGICLFRSRGQHSLLPLHIGSRFCFAVRGGLRRNLRCLPRGVGQAAQRNRRRYHHGKCRKYSEITENPSHCSPLLSRAEGEKAAPFAYPNCCRTQRFFCTRREIFPKKAFINASTPYACRKENRSKGRRIPCGAGNRRRLLQNLPGCRKAHSKKFFVSLSHFPNFCVNYC